MGRPTKLTPEFHKCFVERVRGGATPERVAVAMGIDPATYYRWMQQGREGDGAYSEFYEDVTRAVAGTVVDAE